MVGKAISDSQPPMATEFIVHSRLEVAYVVFFVLL